MASANDPGDRKWVRSGTRTAGRRRAREAKQLRDARRRERERALEAALVDYYTWLALVEETREKARKRAGRILAEAEEAVQMPLAQAGNALRRLRDLGETREAIRELTQISTSRLREILAHAPRSSDAAGHAGAAAHREGRKVSADGEQDAPARPEGTAALRARYEGDPLATSPAPAGPAAEPDGQEKDYLPRRERG